jgi:hypothetical protein
MEEMKQNEEEDMVRYWSKFSQRIGCLGIAIGTVIWTFFLIKITILILT